MWPWNSPLLLTQKPTASCLLCNLKTCSPATPRLWCCIFPGWFVWRLLSHFLVCRRQLGPPLLLQPLKDKIITELQINFVNQNKRLPAACRHTISTVIKCSWVKGKKCCIWNLYPWQLSSLTSTCTRMVPRDKYLYYQVHIMINNPNQILVELILHLFVRQDIFATALSFCTIYQIWSNNQTTL